RLLVLFVVERAGVFLLLRLGFAAFGLWVAVVVAIDVVASWVVSACPKVPELALGDQGLARWRCLAKEHAPARQAVSSGDIIVNPRGRRSRPWHVAPGGDEYHVPRFPDFPMSPDFPDQC